MRVAVCSMLLMLIACFEPAGPAEIAFGSESCSFCRMVISDKRFPAQIVRLGEDPRSFDDLDCLARHVREHPLPQEAHVFVTDYKNSTWIPAPGADFFRCPGMASPMSSGLIASAKAGTPTFCAEVAAGTVREGAAVSSPVLLCARQELTLAVRSRWTQIFAIVFALLASGVAWSGYILSGGSGVQEYARTSVP